MRGRAFRRFAAAGVLTLAVSAIAGATALANETPHISIAAPRTTPRERTLTFSGATTGHFRNLRAYSEPMQTRGGCAPTFATRPRTAREFGWNDVVPADAAGLASFERKEMVPSGDTGEGHLLCAYLVSSIGHVGARAQLFYRDPALR